MKRIALALLASVSAATFAADSANATVTFYTDYLSWASAVNGTVYVNTFNGPVAVTAPDLSVSSSVGYGDGSKWQDRLTPGGNTTTWSFSAPVNAFGGLYDLTPGGPGTGIAFIVDGVLLSQEVPNSYSGQWFGFVSTTSFTTVTEVTGTQPGIAETHTLDNLSYSVAPTPAVPELSSWALMMLGFGGLGFAASRRKSVAA